MKKDTLYPKNKYIEPLSLVDDAYSYNDLTDLPQINGVTLIGNKTSDDLKIEKLPEVSQNENGNFCRVQNGKWVAYKIANAEGVGF